MTERIIKTADELDVWFTFLSGRKLPITVTSNDGRDRTLDQNRLMFLWASEASQQLGDRTVDDIRFDWKLRHGVPILREDGEAFRAFYDKALKPLPYEQKVAAMRFVPVTSEMNVRQMIRYLDAVSRECAEQGIVLTDPDPELAAYQRRYRNTTSEQAA